MADAPKVSEVADRSKSAVIVSVLLWALVVGSVGIRLINLASPILERHGFRQTQTAMTIWMFATDGISMVDYQTPVFGPPWRIPYEFPIFQATAAVLLKLGFTENIDVAARLTNILYFYLSAFVLFRLCRMIFQKKAIPWCIILLYLWMPYNILWSRTCMIDFTSVVFALGYMYFFLRWLDCRKRHLWILTVVFGSVGYLAKTTTMPVVVLPLVYYVIRHVVVDVRRASQPSPLRAVLSYVRREKGFIILLAVAVIVPLIANGLWIAHTNHIKAQSEYTSFAVMGSEDENIGLHTKWAERLSYLGWSVFFDRIRQSMLPRFALLLLPVGLWCIHKYSRREKDFVYATFATSLLTLFLLYTRYFPHDYYMMAISPWICVAAGFGIYHLFFVTLRSRKWLMAVCLFLALLSYGDTWEYLRRPFTMSYQTHVICALGRGLQMVTPEDEYIIVSDWEWSPAILYYAKRKGFMMWREEWQEDNDVIRDPRFTTYVSRKEHPKMREYWRRFRKVGQVGPFLVHKVGN